METFGVYQPRCFGLLISPGKDVKHSEMNLLDNMVRGPSSPTCIVTVCMTYCIVRCYTTL